MTGCNTGYGNKTGKRKVTGIEFNTGYGYVSGERNKSG